MQLGSPVSSSLLTSVAASIASSLPISISTMQNISTAAAGEVDFAMDTASLEQMHAGVDAGLGEVGMAEGAEDDHLQNPMQVDGAMDYLESIPQFDGMGDGDDETAATEGDDGLISEEQAAFQEEEEQPGEQQAEQHHMDDVGEADIHHHHLESDALTEGFSSAEQGKAFLDEFQSVPVEPLMEGFTGTDDNAEASFQHAGDGEEGLAPEEGISHMQDNKHEQYHRDETEYLLQASWFYIL